MFKFIIIFFFLAFWIKGVVSLDPDFGWHIRLGQLISESGIPKTDPFSYSMPSYPFIDHEWLSNVIIAKLYPLIGMVGISAIASFFAIMSLAISLVHRFPLKMSSRVPIQSGRGDLKRLLLRPLRPNRNDNLLIRKFSLIPMLLSFGIIFSFVGVRVQVMTWFFLSFLLLILLNEPIFKKYKFLIPFIFILWVNLHGGFAIGIVTLFIVFISKTLERRKFQIDLLLLVFFSLIATFINPYNLRIWYEVWNQISDSSLRFTIAEWLPSIFFPNFALWFFIPFSVLFVLRARKNLPLIHLLLFSFFLALTISSMRNAPFFILISLILTPYAIFLFYQEAVSTLCHCERNEMERGNLADRDCFVVPPRNDEIRARFNKAHKVLIIIVFFAVLFQFSLTSFEAYGFKEDLYYPKQAIGVIRNSILSSKNIFADYAWGGYLVWKLPDKKVFIDGRMPSWRWKAPNAKESNYALKEYTNVENGKITLKDISEKYNTDTFVLSGYFEKRSESGLMNLWQKVFKQSIRVNNKSKLIKNDKNWVNTYSDQTVVIYQKKI